MDGDGALSVGRARVVREARVDALAGGHAAALLVRTLPVARAADDDGPRRHGGGARRCWRIVLRTDSSRRRPRFDRVLWRVLRRLGRRRTRRHSSRRVVGRNEWSGSFGNHRIGGRRSRVINGRRVRFRLVRSRWRRSGFGHDRYVRRTDRHLLLYGQRRPLSLGDDRQRRRSGRTGYAGTSGSRDRPRSLGDHRHHRRSARNRRRCIGRLNGWLVGSRGLGDRRLVGRRRWV